MKTMREKARGNNRDNREENVIKCAICMYENATVTPLLYIINILIT